MGLLNSKKIIALTVVMASLTMVPVYAASHYMQSINEASTNPDSYVAIDVKNVHPTAGGTNALCVDVAKEKAKAKEAHQKEVAAAKEEKEQKEYIASLKSKIKQLKKENASIKAENESLKKLKVFNTEEVPFYDVTIPEYKGTKTYERYTKIHDTSRQGKLQKMAITDRDDFRLVNGRYTIAIGSATRAYVGQYVDVILKNGVTIPCIMGDQKADCDTEENNLITAHSQCASEFIMDPESLPKELSEDGHGDVSVLYDDWKSPVKTIRVYNMFVPGIWD